jgi:xylose isomerase
MEDHLRFAVCMWHTFCWPGSDVFGAGTFKRPWHAGPNDLAHAKLKREAALAFIEKLDVPFYCFHDVDVMADAEDPRAFRASFAEAVDHLEALQAEHGRQLLWGTANLFSHPRYMAGAATNPDPEVFAWAAMQVKDALDATHRLKGANYVLWGGREGYDTILNTEIGIEQTNFGRFLSLVVDHKHRIGFKGTILIEPKPHEPTKHQYDFDTQTVYGFLKRFGLENEVKVNIEANHATLSGHTFEHELAMARALGIMGSIDANRGDPQNGWDTDQFPNSVEELTLAMLELLRGGGFTTGGFNFDAKVRRQSIDAADLFHGHIGGIDTIARALLGAAAILEDGRLEDFRAERYAGWKGPLGQKIHHPATTLADLAHHAVAADQGPVTQSGRQEWCENLINRLRV